MHQLALGDLELDERRIDAGRRDDGPDALLEVMLAELPRREVHRHRHRRRAEPLPELQILAGALQHPLAHGNDEPGLLEYRNELDRRHAAALRMAPAQERLRPARLPIRKVDLRLVVQAELAALERAAQLETHLRARPGARVDVGGEELEGVAPGLLGAVHRRVGRAKQHFRVVAVRRERGDADARRHHDFLAADDRRGGEAIDDLLRNERRIVGLRQVGQHDGELIAADARDRVAITQRGLQALCRLLQELVSRGVTLRVVHQLEVIEVDEQHAERNVASARLHDHQREAVGEKRAVRQPGERIELREVGETRLAVQPVQRRRHHARGRGQESSLLRPERPRRLGHGAQHAARPAVRRHRHRGERAVAAQPFERQRQSFLPRPVHHHGIRRLEERREHAVRRNARDRGVGRRRAEPRHAAQHHFALAAAALQIGHRAAAETLEHALHRLRHELGGIALGQRRLPEARDLLLVARLRGAALLGGEALGQVA